MATTPANATNATPMEADANSEMSQDVFHGVPPEVLRSGGEKRGSPPLKRGLDKVQPLTPNQHHFALHMGCCNAPKNPGCVTARVRNMGESLENKNKTLHQVVHQVATESNRKQAQASAS